MRYLTFSCLWSFVMEALWMHGYMRVNPRLPKRRLSSGWHKLPMEWDIYTLRKLYIEIWNLKSMLGCWTCLLKTNYFTDIYCFSVLLNEKNMVKICDFGVSRIWDSLDNGSMSLCGITRYMAPEMINNKNFSNKVGFLHKSLALIYSQHCLETVMCAF